MSNYAELLQNSSSLLLNETEESTNPEEKTASIENKQLDQCKKVRWKSTLTYPTDKILEETLNTTTSFCEQPVESENRNFLIHHYKKHLHALYPKRIRGRTDSDTFFLSITLIQKFK